MDNKTEARERIKLLVDRFNRNIEQYKKTDLWDKDIEFAPFLDEIKRF